MSFIALGMFSPASSADRTSAKEALRRLASDYPESRIYRENDGRIARVYGQPFGSGSDPVNAANRFRVDYSGLFGVFPDDLRPESILEDGRHTTPVMYDSDTGQYKFTLVYYSQYKDGIPVYRADLRLLFRNEAGYPLVLASSALRDLGDFAPNPSAAAADPFQVQRSFAISIPYMTNFSLPKTVIWAGMDDMEINPTVGVMFIADDGNKPTTEKMLYIIEPLTGDILYQEDMVIDIDVSGQVEGKATENFNAEQCGNEIATGLPYSRVNIVGGSSAFADSAGDFVIPNGGSSTVTVESYIRGQWFRVYNTAGSDSYISQSVTPPGPANFLHNSANSSEYYRGEVNAYLHSNVVRDFTLRYNPAYPVIYNQVEFPVYVNRNDGYCPGNAWYDYSSINFCRSGSGYPNTAFSTVVHHEYGHHLVSVGGSGQGAYGEGMGDVVGNMITDNPGAAWGFFGPCNQALRNADNTMQYPCSGEIHYCGQLISGCVWSTRDELAATHPLDYLDIISNLAVNSILLHTGTEITPSITIDYLTLDDNDGNIGNGTPHWAEICAGFGAHNMTCPPLELMGFNYPNGLPSSFDPSGGTTVRVEVFGISGTPQPGTGMMYYNSGSGWSSQAMQVVSPNVYNAVFPSFDCGVTVHYYFSAQTTAGFTVTDPDNAPSASYSALAATGITILYQDDFSTNQGWSGMGGSAEWTIGVAAGGAGSDSYGGPDPAVDHSPSTDNRVLGNDLTSGSGGDYSAGLTTTYWATSPVINCSGAAGVTLKYFRWLGLEQSAYDHGYLQVFNGSSWITLFTNSVTIDESVWNEQLYDVSTYADNNPNFRIRFGLGTTDGSWQYCGWNIDDILVSSAECSPALNGILNGTVTYSGGPVSGVQVDADDGSGNAGSTVTAGDGTYTMELPVSSYSVSFSHIDYRDTTIGGVGITDGGITTLNVVMDQLPGSITGVVRDQASAPVNGVIVTAGGTSISDTTDPTGAYILGGLSAGSYNVSFSHLDYRDTTAAGINVTPGDITVLNMTIAQLPGWISGVVTDTAGAPIESVYVEINPAAGLLDFDGNNGKGLSLGKSGSMILAVDSVYTDILGRYQSSLPAGNYNLTFSHSLYRDTTVVGAAVTPNDTTGVSVSLRPVNLPPVITSPAAASATEDIFFSYTASAYDPEGSIPVIGFENYASWMSIAGDIISGIPLEGDPDTVFTVIASDGEFADTLIVTVTVTPVNDPPSVISPDTATAIEDQLFSYLAEASDPDGTTPIISFENTPSWMTVAGDTISGIPLEGFPDTSFTVIAADGQYADTVLVSVTVVPFNDPPVFTSPSAATATEDESFSYIAAAYDPEGNDITYSFINMASWLSVSADTVFGIPLEGDSDTSFAAIASDGEKAETLTVAIDVIPVNDPPVIISPDTASATEDELFIYIAAADDPDSPVIYINYENLPDWLNVIGDAVSGIPLEADHDTSFTVIAFDGQYADTIDVVLTVVPVNDPPYITSEDSVFAFEGGKFTYIGAAIDPDGTIPIIGFIDYPSWLTVTGDTISGTPSVNNSDTTFTVIASDTEYADSLEVTVTVIAINHAPQIISADTVTVEENSAFAYIAVANDPDGSDPAISFENYPSWMNVVGDTISGMPLVGYPDTSFVIIASDGELADSLTVTVLILHVNVPPYITSPDSVIAQTEVFFTYLATAEDPDGTDPVITFESYPAWMAVSGSTILGYPPEGSPDTSFVVIASDGQLADTLEVVVTVISGCAYTVGDVNGSGTFNGLDVTYMVSFLKGGSAPTVECECPPHSQFYLQGDVNASCSFNGLDVTYSVGYFKGGSQPMPCPDCPPAGGAAAGIINKESPVK